MIKGPTMLLEISTWCKFYEIVTFWINLILPGFKYNEKDKKNCCRSNFCENCNPCEVSIISLLLYFLFVFKF